MNTLQPNRFGKLAGMALFALLVSSCIISCTKDDPLVPPDNSGDTGKRFMFCYNKSDAAESYCTRLLGTTLGSAIQCSQEYQLFCGWQHVAGVQVDKKLYQP